MRVYASSLSRTRDRVKRACYRFGAIAYVFRVSAQAVDEEALSFYDANLDAIINISLNIKIMMKNQTVRTTITLPVELLAAADRVVSEGKAKSRNEFVAQALLHELEALKRAEIDAALEEMAQDPEYQTQVLRMEAEFAAASWEALQLEESPA